MTEKINRTSAATAARMRASEGKAARRLFDRGWLCWRTGPENLPFKPAVWDDPTAQIYATCAMQETARVIGFEMSGKPILDGPDGPYVGELDYVYSVGRK